jgi:hypothetical protein
MIYDREEEIICKNIRKRQDKIIEIEKNNETKESKRDTFIHSYFFL